MEETKKTCFYNKMRTPWLGTAPEREFAHPKSLAKKSGKLFFFNSFLGIFIFYAVIGFPIITG
jgi:hypothetical protein